MAGVFLVRALRDSHDLAVLTALGTGPRGLFWHILTQSAAVCITAGVAGAALAQWSVSWIATFIPAYLPRPEHIGIAAPVLLAGFSLSLICGFIFGAPAALQALKLPGSGALRTQGRAGNDRDDGPRGLLVMAEVAFCLVVVTGAGLLQRSFLRLENVNPGFSASNLLTFRLVLAPSKYPERGDVVKVRDRLVSTLRQIPGVVAGQASNLPLSGMGGEVDLSVVESRRKTAKVLDAPYVAADESYFEVMRIPVLAGRGLDSSDTASSVPVGVISRNLAGRLAGPTGPVGMRLRIDDDAGRARELTVVGVVGDVSDEDLEKRPAGSIYVPFRQMPQSFAFFFVNNTNWVVRTPGPPMDFAREIQSRVAGAAQDAGLSKMQPMQTYLNQALQARLFLLRAVVLFAAGVLVLAALGLYAPISHSVHQRTREIGVRVVLGARSRQIVMDVMGEGLTLTCAGIGIGLGAIFVLARILSTMLFEVPVYDPLTILGSMHLMIVVAVVATSGPAHQATKLDPIRALRQK